MATAHTNFYDPTAAAIARNVATAQNEAMVANVVATGQSNMAALERGVIKDNTLLPGEWYGGQLHFAPPETDASGPKTYRITIQVGSDLHENRSSPRRCGNELADQLRDSQSGE